MINNPYNLQIGQKVLVKHKSDLSPWIEVKIVGFDRYGYPIGKNLEQNFHDSLIDTYEVLTDMLNSKEEALLAWKERAKHDKKQFPNEESAFNYYWQMSH